MPHSLEDPIHGGRCEENNLPLLEANHRHDWPASASVHVSPFKAVSLARAAAVTDAPPALPNKVFAPHFYVRLQPVCRGVKKDNCGCNRYLLSSQSGGELFRTVTLNKLSDSFECSCHLKTSLPPHLRHARSELGQLPLTVSLSCRLSKVDKASKLPDHYPSARKNNCFPLCVKCLLARRDPS